MTHWTSEGSFSSRKMEKNQNKSKLVTKGSAEHLHWRGEGRVGVWPRVGRQIKEIFLEGLIEGDLLIVRKLIIFVLEHKNCWTINKYTHVLKCITDTVCTSERYFYWAKVELANLRALMRHFKHQQQCCEYTFRIMWMQWSTAYWSCFHDNDTSYRWTVLAGSITTW